MKPPLTPQSLTKYHQSLWKRRFNSINIVAPTLEKCPYTAKDLKRLDKEGRRVGYLPRLLSTQKSRYLLGEMFPKMESWSLEKDNTCENVKSPWGWFDYESAIEAPYLDTMEGELITKIDSLGKSGMNLNQYIVAGQDSKHITGRYLDEMTTWCRLLGSRYEGYVVYAYFYSYGYLDVYQDLLPQYHYSNGGGRSVGVPSLSLELPKKTEPTKKKLKTIVIEINIYETN